MKSLRRVGRDKTEHHAVITDEDLVVLRRSEAMNPNTPRGLVNKVWFDIQLHFGRRGKEGLRKLTPQSLKVFYLHPKRGEKLGDVWYSLEPMGVNYLGSMLSRISKEAGTSVVYTNHCIRSTTIQKLAEDTGPRVLSRATGHLL
ncbi:zinc finger MYM-type protein 4-like protein [Lates japonicus]|uniref:Zinc finger MYM-type protein 4-like protein n=1 Tax=Lates japonicus TaxID=270547 RepID=A0AAD3N9C4_LATJO|nr:zinc finger MYM-type protein 4-like protein [Lates japonicus]